MASVDTGMSRLPFDLNQMTPTFSVVIPTFNRADFLKGALSTVLDQSYKDFEVVVVDNFSTDSTLSVIRQFNDPRVQVVQFQNQGVIGAARNVGIKKSQGQYVAFLDSDDTWYQGKLERVAREIAADPGVGLLCHNQDMVRDGRVAVQTRYGPSFGFRGSMTDFILCVADGPSTSATVVARRYLDEAGHFSEERDLITVEDYDLWVKLSRLCRFKFLPDVLGTHNYHSGSVSADVNLHLRNALVVLERHFGETRGRGGQYPRRTICRRYATIIYGAARQSQRNSSNSQGHRLNSFKETAGYYFRALRTYPFIPRAYAGLAILFADLLLGQSRRQKIARTLWAPSWKWG